MRSRLLTLLLSLSSVTATAASSLRMILPPEIYAVPGHEINIYFDNVILTPNIRNYPVDVTCARGRQDEERWLFTPTPEDVGAFPLTLSVMNAQNDVIAKARTRIVVSPADAGVGSNLTMLLVGDSLTDAPIYPNELARLLRAPGNPTTVFIGSHAGSGKPPHDMKVPHEGRGGWTWRHFCEQWDPSKNDYRAMSPFLFENASGQPRLDFQKYLDEVNSGRPPDFITILLGGNDVFLATDKTIEETIDSMFRYADTLIGEIQRVAPETRIGLVTMLPPNASQDAFGPNYACGPTRWQYRRNQHRVVERLFETYGQRQNDRIFVVPAYVNLDCKNNYPTREERINARNDKVITKHSNGVHPAKAGYFQMADSIYYWIKRRLAEESKTAGVPAQEK